MLCEDLVPQAQLVRAAVGRRLQGLASLCPVELELILCSLEQRVYSLAASHERILECGSRCVKLGQVRLELESSVLGHVRARRGPGRESLSSAEWRLRRAEAAEARAEETL